MTLVMTLVIAWFGLKALVVGQFALTRRRVVYRWQARMVGLLLLGPLVGSVVVWGVLARQTTILFTTWHLFLMDLGYLTYFLTIALVFAARTSTEVPSKRPFLARVEATAQRPLLTPDLSSPGNPDERVRG
jgi:hypothetical protein